MRRRAVSSGASLVISLFLLGLAGCPGRQDQPVTSTDSAAHFQGQTIGVALPAELGFGSAWELSLREWAASTNAEPKLREFDARMNKPLPELLQTGDTAEAANCLIFFPLN